MHTMQSINRSNTTERTRVKSSEDLVLHGRMSLVNSFRDCLTLKLPDAEDLLLSLFHESNQKRDYGYGV